MSKIKMTRWGLYEKYGLHTACDIFCMIRRGHRTVPKKCHDIRYEKEMSIHCREAENALAAYYNIELID